ncbi:ATPase [uncultured Alistipes sp.]|uniref:ATPase n=1 Tax=uncultured Alistipes sp. TaxID=538949 RepID=UPI00262B9787|nr:ATPase [uncultured Alistipes sp.]
MMLLADSGSTKTDWCLVEGGTEVLRVETGGTNPFFQTPERIGQEIDTALLPRLGTYAIRSVFFYGAGCAFPDKIETVRGVLATRFPEARVEVGSDMTAAARALCGRRRGIACILGTGSNSCLWNGEAIEANVSPLGFILGDEGSGAVLGRRLVGDCLKNRLPRGLREEFLARFDLTPAAILERVYRQPFPNRFLASLSPFLAERIDVPEIRAIVFDGFVDFFRRNVMQYDGWDRLEIHAAGSVAYYYREVLREAAAACGLRLGTVVRSPMAGLVAYHSSEE